MEIPLSLDISKYEYELEKEERRKRFKELKKKEREEEIKKKREELDNKLVEYFIEWRKQKLKEGKTDIPDLKDISVKDFVEAGRNLAYGNEKWIFEGFKVSPKYLPYAYEFFNFVKNKRREEIKELSEDEIIKEIKAGGITDDKEIFLDPFGRQMIKQGTLHIFSPKHPIYGEKVSKVYPLSDSLGQIAGEIISFYSLGAILKGIGLTGKIMSWAEKTKRAKAVMKALGYPKYVLGKAEKARNLIKGMINVIRKRPFWYGIAKYPGKYATPEIAAGAGITGGVIGAIQNFLKLTLDKLRKEDEMDRKSYLKSLPRSLAEGFFQKYFIGVINDPENWPLRILGDALYSVGQQGYEIAIGERKHFDWDEYWYNFIFGHLLGEVQGIMFKMPIKMRNDLYENENIAKYAIALHKKFGGKVEDYWFQAYSMWLGELEHYHKTGLFYNKEQFDKVINAQTEIIKDGYTSIFRKLLTDDIKALTRADYERGIKKNIEDAYKILGKRLNLDKRAVEEAKTKDILKDIKTFKSFLKSQNRFIKKVPVYRKATREEALSKIGKMDYDDFESYINSFLTKYRITLSDIKDYAIEFREAPEEYKPAIEEKPKEYKPLSQESMDRLSKYANGLLKYGKKQEKLKIIKGKAGKLGKKLTWDDAEEIFSEAIEKLCLLSEEQFKKIKNLDQYFNKILINTTIEYLKQRGKISEISLEKEVEGKPGEKARKLEEVIPDIRNAIDKLLEGIDEHSTAIYKLMYKYINAGRDKELRTKQIITFYLSKAYNLSYKDIADIFKELGLGDIRVGTLKVWDKRVRNYLADQINNQRVKTEETKELKFSDDEVKEIYNEITEKSKKFNEITGVRGDFETDLFCKNVIKKKGAYFISFRRVYNKIKETYGENIANKVLAKAGELLTELKNEVNSWQVLKDSKQRIYLKSPFNLPEVFIIYSDKIEDKKFEEIGAYINKVLKENFDEENIKNLGRAFAISIEKPDGSYEILTNFDVDIFKTKEIDLDVINRYANVAKNIKQLMAIFLPEVHPSLLNYLYIDIDKPEIKPEIEAINKIVPLDKETVDISKIVSLQRQAVRGSLTKIFRYADDFTELPPECKIDRDIGEGARAVVERANEELKEDNYDTYLEKLFQDGILPEIEVIKNAFKKTKEETSKFFIQLYKAVLNKFTVFEDIEKKNPAAWRALQMIYMLSDAFEKGDIRTAILLKAMAGEFVGKRVGRKKLAAWDRVMMDIIEWEYKNIRDMSKREYLNEVKKPIKFKKNALLDKDGIKRLFEHPESINDREMTNIHNSVLEEEKRLLFTKILVQYVGIDPLELRDVIMRNVEYFWGVIPQIAGLQVDKNVDYFENKKMEIREALIKLFQDNNIVEIDNINFDDLSQKSDVFSLLNRLPENVRGQGERLAEAYYLFAENKFSYIRHIILGNKKNNKRFDSHINRFLRGELPRGIKNADPFIEELFTQRKIPTLMRARELGYEIPKSYLAVTRATAQYVYSKVVNRNIAEGFKNSILSEFTKIYEKIKPQFEVWEKFKNSTDPEEIKKAEEARKEFLPYLREFFKEVTAAYFWIPTNRDFTKIDGQINKIKKEIQALEQQPRLTTAQANRMVELNAELTKLQDKRKAMNRLRQMFIAFPQLIKKNLFMGQRFYPLNRSSYTNDKEIKAEYDSQYIGTRFKKEWMPNISDYDGLYFNAIMLKAMKNFVTRDDLAYKGLWKYYDRINIFMKIASFVKPGIIGVYDCIQATIADPLWVASLPKAIRIWFHRGEIKEGKLTKDAKFYELARENNVFNKTVSWKPFLTEAEKAVYEILGKPALLGKILDEIGERSLIEKFIKIPVLAHRGIQSITWSLDEIIRLSLFERMYRRFSRVYGEGRKAAFMAAEWTNLFTSKYSRIPTSTRQWLNRFGFVLTYRIQAIRMWKEMFKMFGSGIKRLMSIEYKDPIMFKISENKIRQALFEMGPLIRAFALRAVVKILLFHLFGYGWENIWDFLYNYRMKKYARKGSIIDSTIKFLALGSPLFEPDKWPLPFIGKRSFTVFMKYNMAKLPGLIWCMATNEQLITGRPIITVNIAKQPLKAGAQFGMFLLTNYFPFGADLSNLDDEELTTIEKIITFTGIGYFYSYKNPRQILTDFWKAFNKAQSFNERLDAIKEFRYKFRRAYRVLMNEEYKDLYEQIREMSEQLEL